MNPWRRAVERKAIRYREGAVEKQEQAEHVPEHLNTRFRIKGEAISYFVKEAGRGH